MVKSLHEIGRDRERRNFRLDCRHGDRGGQKAAQNHQVREQPEGVAERTLQLAKLRGQL